MLGFEEFTHALSVFHPIAPIDDKTECVDLFRLFSEIHNISTSSPNLVEYRTYLLTDIEETLIYAVCYGNNIGFFERSLQPYRHYYVSNAYVKQSKPSYRVSKYECSWVFYNTTLVEPYEEAIPPTLPYEFDPKSFSELTNYSNLDNTINIKGIIVHASTTVAVRKDLTARDFIIIDETKTPIGLRLWHKQVNHYGDELADSYPEPTFILAMHLKVTTFNG